MLCVMHNDDMLTASDVLKMRKHLGESQEVFGARFGVDQSTVHRWETIGPPKRGPAKMVLQKLRDETATTQTEAAE